MQNKQKMSQVSLQISIRSFVSRLACKGASLI